MLIAKRVYSLAQEQNDSALMIGAHRALAVTLFYLGDFETAQQHAMRGVQIWRSKGVQSPVEEVHSPAVACLCYEALSGWHLGAVASSQATVAGAILLARELNDMHALAVAIQWAGWLAHFQGNPVEVECYASELIELSTRQHFATWLPGGAILRGWARSASGHLAEGISWIEHGIGDYQETGSMLAMPYFLALKAEALHLGNRTVEALVAITEAEAVVERTEERWWCAELHRLRGVFLTTIGAKETKIEASFCAAIKTGREQKAISLTKRAEASYAEYRNQKPSTTGGRGIRLPLG
jgi:predicted ATPase